MTVKFFLSVSQMDQDLQDYYKTTTKIPHPYLLGYAEDLEKLQEKFFLELRSDSQNLLAQFGEMKEWPKA